MDLTLATANSGELAWTAMKWILHLAAFLMVVFHCLANRKEPAPTVAWIFVAWLFPVLGPLAYLAFGIDRVPYKGFEKHLADQKLLAERKARERHSLPLAYWRSVHDALATTAPSGAAQRLEKAMDFILPEYPLLGGNSIKPLVTGDEAFPAMLNAIRNARHHIHLQTFMFKNDSSSREFLDAMAERARSGVRVRLLYDRFGSTYAVWSGLFRRYRRIPNFSIAGWTQANVLKRQFQINLRNHRKVLVVDGREAFCGGINIHDENLSANGSPPIRDYHFALRGPIVQELQYSFLRDWHFITDENPDAILTEQYFPRIEPEGSAMIRLINSGPSATEMEIIADVFFLALALAERRVIAVTPYFVPQRDLLHAFRAAALRGVDVRLVVPARNNHVYAGLAARALYGDLLKAGVRVFERRPPFMHAKALLVDDTVAIVGTANMDARSLRLNYETNLAVYDETFHRSMRSLAEAEMELSDEVNIEDWLSRPAKQRMIENLCYLMMPVL